MSNIGITYTKFKKTMLGEKLDDIKNGALDDDNDEMESFKKKPKTSETKSKTPVLDNFCRDISRAVEKGEIDTGRSVERELGEHLAAQLRPGDQVATDMPRLAFFAGRKPPPPRAFTAADLEAALADPRCTHLALVRGRGGIDVDPVSLAGRGFEPMILPSGLAAAAEARGVLVFSRTTPR